jgi:hypothetical protein
MAWANSDIMKENLQTELDNLKKKYEETQQDLEILQDQVFKIKNKLSDCVNLVFEKGDAELLDGLERIVSG